jgi:hypothetical protein
MPKNNLEVINVSIGYDGTFELNEFKEPKLSSEIEVVKNALLTILFSKPGQYPSLPTIGLDIQNMLYSFYDEIDVDKLKQQILDQCSALGAYFSDGSIGIKKMIYQNKPSLLIYIQGDESYPSGYKRDSINSVNTYLVGITFDELNKMVYNINALEE